MVEICGGADWEVQRAAMEAILRPIRHLKVEDLGQSATDGASTKPVPSPTSELPSSDALRTLVNALEIEVKPSGGLTIEAPPEVARTLASLFDAMAGALRASAPPTKSHDGDES